jgi:hypothetical protein
MGFIDISIKYGYCATFPSIFEEKGFWGRSHYILSFLCLFREFQTEENHSFHPLSLLPHSFLSLSLEPNIA